MTTIATNLTCQVLITHHGQEVGFLLLLIKQSTTVTQFVTTTSASSLSGSINFSCLQL